MLCFLCQPPAGGGQRGYARGRRGGACPSRRFDGRYPYLPGRIRGTQVSQRGRVKTLPYGERAAGVRFVGVDPLIDPPCVIRHGAAGGLDVILRSRGDPCGRPLCVNCHGPMRASAPTFCTPLRCPPGACAMHRRRGRTGASRRRSCAGSGSSGIWCCGSRYGTPPARHSPSRPG